MEQRLLGQSNIKVSALSLGSWMTYETMPEDQALAVIQAGLAAGMNFLDDARYNDRTGKAPLKTGYSEVLFGRLLRRTGVSRHDLVVANKLWFEFFPEESIEAELDGSLSRLGMDYLDIVYCAERPESLPVVDLIGELDRLIGVGKLRTWGVLNWTADQIREAVSLAAANGLRPPTGAQLAYSVLTRSPVEDAEMQQVLDYGVGVVASYSLYGGLLSGKYQHAAATPEGRLHEHLATPAVQAMLPRVEAFVAMAQELGCTPSQLAFAYCLRNPRVASVLFGSRRVEQVRENVGALDVMDRLTGEVMMQLRRL